MNRHKLVYVSVIAMLIFSIVIASSSFTVSANLGGVEPTKSVTLVDSVKVEIGKQNPRLVELNRVLGISMAQLQKLSGAEVKDLIVKNAEKLGVMVYNTTVNSKSGEIQSVLIAGTKVFKAPDYQTSLVVLPTPTVPAYPAPKTVKNNVPVSGGALTTIYKTHLPILFNPPNTGDATLTNVQDRMAQAKTWVDLQYMDMDDWSQGYVKEYPGCPLSIQNTDNPNGLYSKRFAGDYYVSKLTPVGKVLSNVVGYQFDWSDYTFEAGDQITSGWNYNQPSVDCDIYYLSNGQTQYIITKTGWDNTGSNLHQRLLLGDTLLWNDVASTPMWQTASVTSPIGGRYASARFTIRHATDLGALFYNYYTDPWKVFELTNTINQYGFNQVPDIYTPMFESGSTAADNYMYTTSAYHDCSLWNQGMDSTITLGYNKYHYPYESKVCATGVLPYIELSKADYLVPALQAIHILNKYGNADHAYTSPSGIGTTTPRQIARWIETKWNGYGIPVFGKDSTVSSSVRTNAFLALEAKLGYQFGDNTSKTYADDTANVLMRVQWGSPPFTQWSGVTEEYGALFRPIHTGGELLMWDSTLTLYPSGGLLSDVVDMFSMPNEAIIPQPSNSESTFTYWAALELYKKYKYNTP